MYHNETFHILNMDRLSHLRQELQLLFEDKRINIKSQNFNIPDKWDKLSLKQQYMIILNKTNIQSLYFELFKTTFPELKLVNNDETRKILKHVVNDLKLWLSDQQELKSKYIDMFNDPKPIKYIDYIGFQVFGCEYSRDIDVAVVVKDHTELTENINKERLYRELEELGYDISRGVDINVIYCNDGMIMGSLKGSKETQNILYLTYHFHKQKYPSFVSGITTVNKEDKISNIAKYILDNLCTFIGDDEYMKERPNKIAAYAGKWNRVIYSLSILDKIIITPKNYNDCVKSLTMKIIQLILLEKGEFEYQKYGLARKFDNIFPGHYDHVIYLLMRCKDGSYNPNTCKLLLQEYHRIASSVNVEDPVWINLSLDITHNPTHLSDLIFNEFVKSPLVPTSIFISEFENVCPNRNVNSFIIPSNNGNLLPDHIKEKAICIPQRSPEWIKLLGFYTCGRNTGVKKYDGDDWVDYYYNLIRGSIVELMVIETCDFTPLIPNYTKVTVGFLVEEKDKAGCKGISPDLLLLVGDDVIPVEIKCLTGSLSDNHNYRRDVLLATKQLESSAILTGSNMGIIVLVYTNNEGFKTYGTIVRF